MIFSFAGRCANSFTSADVAGLSWRLLFSVREADENDPPTVRLQRVQHGAQEPLTEWPAEDEG